MNVNWRFWRNFTLNFDNFLNLDSLIVLILIVSSGFFFTAEIDKKYNGPYLYLVSFRSSVFMIFIIFLILFFVLVGFSISMF